MAYVYKFQTDGTWERITNNLPTKQANKTARILNKPRIYTDPNVAFAAFNDDESAQNQAHWIVTGEC